MTNTKIDFYILVLYQQEIAGNTVSSEQISFILAASAASEIRMGTKFEAVSC
jgi:hypothetical protein